MQKGIWQESLSIFDKKILSQVSIKGTYFSIIKAIYDKSRADIILNGEKLKDIPLISGMRQECPVSNLIQHSLKLLPEQLGKKNLKNHPDWKKMK